MEGQLGHASCFYLVSVTRYMYMTAVLVVKYGRPVRTCHLLLSSVCHQINVYDFSASC